MLRLLAKRAHMAPCPVTHQHLGFRRFFSGTGNFHQQSGAEPNREVSRNAGSQQEWTLGVNGCPAVHIDKLDLDVFIVERGVGAFKGDLTKNIRDLCSRMGAGSASTEPSIAESDSRLKPDARGNLRKFRSDIRKPEPGVLGNFWKTYRIMILGFFTSCTLVWG
ncbi:hypothetical protein HOY80DRAFT_1133643, partial [Tuber brumale]